MDKFHVAIHETAHEYLGGAPAGGVPSLAKVINMREGTFYNQVNPNTEGACVNVDTFRAMLLATKDFRALDELERDCGRVAYKLPDFSKIGDGALLESYTAVHKELGDVAEKLHKALADGDLTMDEANTIEKEALEQISALMAFVQHVKMIAKK